MRHITDITKTIKTALLLGAAGLALFTNPAQAQSIAPDALPTGGRFVGGAASQGSFDTSVPNRLTINQSTERAVINFESFNIGANAAVRLNQPSVNSLTVKRVTGPGRDPSQILGNLQANGRVVLLNRNGVIFGENATVDVGAIIASTGRISNRNALNADTLTFRGAQGRTGNAGIINKGTITVREGGLAAFVSPLVINKGTINARLGNVTLASGNRFTVDLYGDRMIEIDTGVRTDVTGVANLGDINAQGGVVQLSVNQAKRLVDNTINLSGVRQATSFIVKGGSIVLGDAVSKELSVSKNVTRRRANTSLELTLRGEPGAQTPVPVVADLPVPEGFEAPEAPEFADIAPAAGDAAALPVSAINADDGKTEIPNQEDIFAFDDDEDKKRTSNDYVLINHGVKLPDFKAQLPMVIEGPGIKMPKAL